MTRDSAPLPPAAGPLPGRVAPRTLAQEAVRRGMRLSVVEGLCFALMVGLGETYFVADAVRLSATRLQLGLVVSLPLFVGSLGPLLALRLLARAPARKPLVVGASLAQAATVAGLAAGDLLGVSTPWSLIACVSLYQLCGQAVGTGWASWFGDLVPGDVRGGYFARRNRGIYLVTSLGILAGGLVLSAVEPGGTPRLSGEGGRGFALVFGLAALARVASALLHAALPEPSFSRPFTRLRLGSFLATERGRSTSRLLVLTAALYFTVYVASPYFTPYMLGPLGFSYLELTAASLVIVVLKVLMLPAWGASIGETGARPVFLTCAVLLSLVPLPWLWASGLGWVLVAQGFSGLSWAGFELALFCVLIEKSFRGVRPHVFALHTALNGVAQLAGGVTGALLAGAFGSDLRLVFALSLAGRLLVTLWLPRATRTARDAEIGRRQVLLRVIGIRPSGGLVLRPVPGGEDAEEEDAQG